MEYQSAFSEEQKRIIRSGFGHLERGNIYLNHAAISPMPLSVASALNSYLEQRQNGPVDNFEEWMKIIEQARRRITALINAPSPRHIGFVSNTSEGISAIAKGFHWHKGDEIILNSAEFPANIQPFRALQKEGVRLVYTEPDEKGIISPGKLESAITDRTKLLSISAVQYLSGFRADLQAIGEICNRHDIFFVVDAIQLLGADGIDVQACNIDGLSAGSHKWLMGPMGTGILYLSDHLKSRLHPTKTGWLSVEDPWQLTRFEQEWAPMPLHLETGTFNTFGLIGLNATLQRIEKTGIEAIRSEIQALSAYLICCLSGHAGARVYTPEDPGQRAGIVTFSIRNRDTDKIVALLKDHHITISAREGYLRISPHYYNTFEEMDRTLTTLFSL